MTTEGSRGSQLRDARRVLRRGRWWILAFVLLVVGSALVRSAARAPLYASTAEVVVRAPGLSSTDRSRFVHLPTEHRVAGSIAVAELAVADLQRRGVTPGGVAVEPVEPQTLRFRAVARAPRTAMATAQAYADAYLAFRREQVTADLRAVADPLAARSAELAAQIADVVARFSSSTDSAERKGFENRMYSLVRLQALVEQERNDLPLPETVSVGTVVRPASLPGSPASPNHWRAGSLALVVGLSFGIGAALVVDRRDERFPTRETLADVLGAPVLAVVPQGRRGPGPAGAVVVDRSSEAGEAYGTLRANLEHALDARRARSVLVTAARHGDGATTTAANLAAALARGGRRVVVVAASGDGGIERSPAEAAASPGLSAAVHGRCAPSEALVPGAVEGVRVLPAGPVGPPGEERFDAAVLRRLLADLAVVADVVVIDGPPLLDDAGSVVLASAVDAVVVVANARRTTVATVRECRTHLRQIDAVVVGSVLNEAGASRHPPEPGTAGPALVRAAPPVLPLPPADRLGPGVPGRR